MKALQLAVVSSIILLAAGGITYVLMHEEWVEKPALRSKLAAKFKDPSSLQFQHEVITQLGWLCGEVNAKNSYGAYGGFTRFITNGDDQTLIDKAEFANTTTTDDLVSLLDQQNAILKGLLAMREARPDQKIEALSPTDLLEAAWKNVFEARWTKICAP